MVNLLNLFRRKESLDLDDLDAPMSHPDPGQVGSFDQFDPTPQSPGPAYGNVQGQSPGGSGSRAGIDHELELISSKLDAIKAMLESLNQRVASLERVAYADQNPPGRRW